MKQNKNKSARSDITVLPIGPGIAVLSAVMLAAFCILMIVLNLGGMISLPGWIERLLGTARDEVSEEDLFSREFLSALSGEEQAITGELVYIETDTESLLPLLLTAKPIHAFYQNCTVTRRAGSESLTLQLFRIVSGDREHAEIVSGGFLSKAITADASSIAVTEGANTRLFPRDSAVFTTESELGLPSLPRMQKMLAEAEAGKYTLQLTSTKDTLCIRAEFTDTASGVREVFEIVPDCGIIFTAASYLPGEETPYYVMTTDSLLTDITGFNESIFEMPNP